MNSKKTKMKKILMASIAGLPLLSACSQTEIGTAERHAISQTNNAADAVFRGQVPLKPDTSNDEISDSIWTGGRAVRADHGSPLPYQWEAYGVTLQKPQQALSLRQIAQKITQATNIPVTFSPDALTPSDKNGPSAQSSSRNDNSSSNSTGLGSAINSLGLSQNPGGGDNEGEAFGDEQRMVVSFKSGPLSALLNEVCSYYGLTWRYDNNDGGRIVIYRNVTRIYHINALPISGMTMSTGMTQSMNSSVSGTGTSSEAAGGKNNQETSANISVKIWDDIEGAIRTIMQASGGGGYISASRSTGTLSVTAPAQVMDKVQNFIDTQNSILSKQVNINVQVLSVQMSASDALQVDMRGILSKFTMGAAAGAAIKASADIGQTVLGFSNKKSQFLIQELSKIGHVEVTTNTDIMTLNGIPAPIQVAHTRGYVAEVQTMVTSTSSTSSSNSQTTLTPGSVTFGFNMMILPEVMPGNDSVLLHFGSSLSDLNGSKDGFDTFTSGNQTVQLVNVISRNFQQEAMVPNGQPVVLSGFQQTNTTSAKSGTGKASFIGLGGTQNGSEDKTMIVIIITPVILSQQAISYSDGN